jgi:hypothetical protein
MEKFELQTAPYALVSPAAALLLKKRACFKFLKKPFW